MIDGNNQRYFKKTTKLQTFQHYLKDLFQEKPTNTLFFQLKKYLFYFKFALIKTATLYYFLWVSVIFFWRLITHELHELINLCWPCTFAKTNRGLIKNINIWNKCTEWIIFLEIALCLELEFQEHIPQITCHIFLFVFWQTLL